MSSSVRNSILFPVTAGIPQGIRPFLPITSNDESSVAWTVLHNPLVGFLVLRDGFLKDTVLWLLFVCVQVCF